MATLVDFKLIVAMPPGDTETEGLYGLGLDLLEPRVRPAFEQALARAAPAGQGARWLLAPRVLRVEPDATADRSQRLEARATLAWDGAASAAAVASPVELALRTLAAEQVDDAGLPPESLTLTVSTPRQDTPTVPPAPPQPTPQPTTPATRVAAPTSTLDRHAGTIGFAAGVLGTLLLGAYLRARR